MGGWLLRGDAHRPSGARERNIYHMDIYPKEDDRVFSSKFERIIFTATWTFQVILSPCWIIQRLKLHVHLCIRCQIRKGKSSIFMLKFSSFPSLGSIGLRLQEQKTNKFPLLQTATHLSHTSESWAPAGVIFLSLKFSVTEAITDSDWLIPILLHLKINAASSVSSPHFGDCSLPLWATLPWRPGCLSSLRLLPVLPRPRLKIQGPLPAPAMESRWPTLWQQPAAVDSPGEETSHSPSSIIGSRGRKDRAVADTRRLASFKMPSHWHIHGLHSSTHMC